MLSRIISRVRQTLTEPTKQTYTGKYNGKPHKYRLTNCVRCKEEKMIHGFTDVCSDCKKREKAEKYYKKNVSPINREPVIAKLPTGIEVLIWAREEIESFKLYYPDLEMMCIGASDSRRFRIYKRWLEPDGYRVTIVKDVGRVFYKKYKGD